MKTSGNHFKDLGKKISKRNLRKNYEWDHSKITTEDKTLGAKTRESFKAK